MQVVGTNWISMMVAIPAGFSPEEYLNLEKDALHRHGFRCGLVYAMAGGLLRTIYTFVEFCNDNRGEITSSEMLCKFLNNIGIVLK